MGTHARPSRSILPAALLLVAAAGATALAVRLAGSERAVADRVVRERLAGHLRYAVGRLVSAGWGAIRLAESGVDDPVAVVGPDGAFLDPPEPGPIPRLEVPRGEDPEGEFYLQMAERAEAGDGEENRARGLYFVAAAEGRDPVVRLLALFRSAALERRRGREAAAGEVEREFLELLGEEHGATFEALVVRARHEADEELRGDLLVPVGGPDEALALGLLRAAGLDDPDAVASRRRDLAWIEELRGLLARGDRGARLDDGRVGGWSRASDGRVGYGIVPLPTLDGSIRLPAPDRTPAGAIADRARVGEPFEALSVAAVAGPSAVEEEARRGTILVGTALLVLLAGGGTALLLAIRAARREAAAARDRAAFVTRVGHDLRTPLAVIRMYAETLAEGKVEDPEQAREFASIAAREAERLTKTVGDALDLTRLSGEDRLVRARTDLAELAREVTESHRPLAEREAMRLVVEADAPVFVAGDPAALRGAAGNLVENAIRHGGGEVAISCGRRGGRAELVVADRGPGLPDVPGDRLLERFVRGPDATGSGAGLGLAVAREVAEAHGGEVRLADREGGGAEVTISLPLAGEVT